MKNQFKSNSFKFILIFLIISILIVSATLSFIFTFEKAKYDSTFKDSFTALVHVKNTKKNDNEIDWDQKNQDKLDIKKASIILYINY